MKKVLIIIASVVVIIAIAILAIVIMSKKDSRITNDDAEKDEKGRYIENEINSIKIEVRMLIKEKTYKTYPMEEIYNNDITKFIENFNFVKFKCTSIEYHKNTGFVKKLIFEEIEN